MSVSLDPQWERRGWAVCYSKSQDRHYYFNKNNGKSVWHLHELEQLEGAPQRNPSTDHDAPEAKRAKPEDDNGAGLEDGDGVFSGETVQFVQKRRLSSVSCHEMAAMVTRKADAGVLQSHRLLWDIDTSSNVVINVDRTFEEQRHHRHLLPPHPDIEQMRIRSTVTLRHKYAELCKSRVGVEEPKESFNRWLLERKVISISGDPLLPALSVPKISQSMHREILADVPVKLRRARNHIDAKKNLLTYAEAANKVVDRRGGTNAQRKTIRWTTEDAFEWMRNSQTHTKDEFEDHLNHLKGQCGPHLRELVNQAVNEVCTKMAELADEEGRLICQEHRKLFQLPPQSPTELKSPTELVSPRTQSHSTVSSSDETEQTEKEKEMDRRWNYEKAEHAGPCSQIKLNRPILCSLPLVTVEKEGEHVRLSYNNVCHRINQSYFDKLEMLYRIHCPEDEDLMDFDARVWCLLTRYQATFGVKLYEGSGLQGSLPLTVFQALKEHFGVTMECFASPLNCYFRQYCSAFADTDGYFGSRGPLLQFHPVGGSFEANPPFSEELMEAMVNHFEALLASTDSPLSFIVFIPDWRDPPTPALVRMEKSKFNQRQHLVPPFEHEYRSGHQHNTSEDEILYRAVHGTLIFFLQNDAGFEVWGPTDERVTSLTQAFSRRQ